MFPRRREDAWKRERDVICETLVAMLGERERQGREASYYSTLQCFVLCFVGERTPGPARLWEVRRRRGGTGGVALTEAAACYGLESQVGKALWKLLEVQWRRGGKCEREAR